MIEIQEAGPMNLLKTIALLVLIYYVFKWLMRLLAPFLIKKVVDTMQQKASEHFQHKNQENTVKQGETVIDKQPTQQQTDNSVGEYVDFEEID